MYTLPVSEPEAVIGALFCKSEAIPFRTDWKTPDEAEMIFYSTLDRERVENYLDCVAAALQD